MVIRKNFKAEKIDPQKKRHPILENAKDEIGKSFSWKFFGKTAIILLGVGALFFFAVQSRDFLQKWMTAFVQQKFISQFRGETEKKTEVARNEMPPRIVSQPLEEENQKKEAVPVPARENQKSFFEILPSSGGGENLIFSSFSDLFSGVGWINQSDTTMYQDRSVTAFLFKPIIRWTKKSNVSNFSAVSRTMRCIKTRCVSSDDANIFSNGERVALPPEVKDATIESISIGALDTRWVVGIVVFRSGKYEGWVYSFDGQSFKKVFGEANTPFLSEYKGTFGFGGTDDEWLVIYGGYRGMGYFLREGKPFQNISDMLSYRIMDGGFDPMILRAGEGNEARFYVYSVSEGKPRLMKFFKNPAGAIGGVVDFSNDLKGQFSQAAFRIVNVVGNATVLEANTLASGNSAGWEIVDEGFETPSVAYIYSVNINNYPAEVRSATIAETQMDAGNAEVTFFLSNDGNQWIEAPLGKEIVFPKKNGTRLLWKAEFKLSGNRSPLFSPFFDKIRLDYKVRFL